MGDNNEQEAADLAAIHNDDDDNIFVVVRYLGGRLDNHYTNYTDENPRPPGVPDYIIPADADARIRLMIDASMTKIDNGACYDCIALTEVVFHNNVITIGRDAFGECSNLRIVELPAGLLRLEDRAFGGCTSLNGTITIPASVQYMGENVLSHCSSLESVVFVPRTASIELGSYMFWRCSDLRFVTLPHNLRSIPAGFFYGCTSLAHPQIPVSVTEIEVRAFRGSGLRSVTFSENIHRIRSGAFEDCALQRVVFAPRTTNIELGSQMFWDCTNLRFVTLPQNLQSIPRRFFKGCILLTRLQLPETVEEIGEEALSGSGIQSIDVPKHVQQIRSGAFKNCALLEKVTIHSTHLTMGNNIFTRCPLLSVIQMYPYLWPTLFASMKEHPDFILQFFRKYHTQIFDVDAKNTNRWWCGSCKWWR